MTSIQIIDSDGDMRDANDVSAWDSVENCLADIKQGLANGLNSANYMPWRIVDWDSADIVEDMEVLTTVKGIYLTLDTTE